MEPVQKSVCEERHERIDERCGNHHTQIEALFNKVNCVIKNQNKNQWLLIAALIALLFDIARGLLVLDGVQKMVGK